MRGSIEPVIPRGEIIWFEYNPPELEFAKEVNWAEVGIPGLDFPLQQFVRGGLATLTLEVYFNRDNYDKTWDVRDSVKQLERLIEKTEKTFAPPVCLFSWGKFYIPCVVGGVSVRYTCFDEDGTPIEATVSLTLRQYLESKQEVFAAATPTLTIRKERKEPVFSGREYGSGSAFAPAEEKTVKEAEELCEKGETKTYTVSEGDSLQSIATKEHGHPSAWRALAFANQAKKGYEKLRDLKEGIEMLVPDPRFPLEIIERVTGLPPETMESLRIAKKVSEEGLERHFKPSLGVLEK
jgi:LysM repeat protein